MEILKTGVLHKEMCVQSLWETGKCRDKGKNKRMLHKDAVLRMCVWQTYLQGNSRACSQYRFSQWSDHCLLCCHGYDCVSKGAYYVYICTYRQNSTVSCRAGDVFHAAMVIGYHSIGAVPIELEKSPGYSTCFSYCFIFLFAFANLICSHNDNLSLTSAVCFIVCSQILQSTDDINL